MLRLYWNRSASSLTSKRATKCNAIEECIDSAVSSSRAIIDKYNELSLSLADPDISEEDMSKAMSQLETIGDKIEAENLWELDRMVERAMDSLRVPPGDAKTAVLSGGEKRRVSLCQLLLGSHDMLLLDEVRLVCRFC
jgi:sulfate-transporting ATPase